jgi:hypothetical protein
MRMTMQVLHSAQARTRNQPRWLEPHDPKRKQRLNEKIKITHTNAFSVGNCMYFDVKLARLQSLEDLSFIFCINADRLHVCPSTRSVRCRSQTWPRDVAAWYGYSKKLYNDVDPG